MRIAVLLFLTFPLIESFRSVGFPGSLIAQTLFTDHTDNSRLASVQETTLTPSNVTTGKFGKLTTITLDGKTYSSPLYIPGLTIGGKTRNVLYTSSNNNTVAAWDADTYAQLWTTGSLDTPCTSNCTGFNWGLNYDDTVGIFSSPVADVANGWIFAVTHTNTPTYKLYKLDLLTGATLLSQTLTASVSPSTASDASGGTLTFNPAQATQRAGLTLANGRVYVMFSSVRDVVPWHGWIMARTETAFVGANFCTNWNQNGGGMWMSNSGAAVDASGNLYVVTGNGGTGSATWTSSYDGITEFSMSILKFSPTLTLLDWYTPSDYATQNSVDTDIGSSHPMLIPNPASAGNYLIVTGGKDFKVYSVPSDCMGHLGGTVGGCPGAQVFVTLSGGDPGTHLGIYGDAFMNNIGYFPNTAGLLYAFTLQNTGLWNTTPVTGATTAFPGAMVTGSINGTSNPIVWEITADSSTLVAPSPGKLRAVNATTLAELWNSGSALGNVAKFLSPTVANGKVYVPTYDSTIQVYGLLPTTTVSGQVTITGQVTVN